MPAPQRRSDHQQSTRGHAVRLTRQHRGGRDQNQQPLRQLNQRAFGRIKEGVGEQRNRTDPHERAVPAIAGETKLVKGARADPEQHSRRRAGEHAPVQEVREVAKRHLQSSPRLEERCDCVERQQNRHRPEIVDRGNQRPVLPERFHHLPALFAIRPVHGDAERGREERDSDAVNARPRNL
jgi:hypothetical protein